MSTKNDWQDLAAWLAVASTDPTNPARLNCITCAPEDGAKATTERSSRYVWSITVEPLVFTVSGQKRSPDIMVLINKTSLPTH